MFDFLEQEGAQVWVEPISGWITYLLHQSRAGTETKRGIDVPYPNAHWWEWKKQVANDWKFRKKWLLLRLSEGLWNHLYARTSRHMGGTHAASGVTERKLARMAHPFYHSLARGGEGHLEVGKKRLLHHSRPMPYGIGLEAIRLHAVFAIRWRAVGRGEPFSGNDLSADRNFG